MAETNCPKCGAPLELEVGLLIADCSYCDTRVFIDKSGAHFYYILPFLSDGQQAIGIFKRWAAGPKKAKNLDSLATVQRLTQQYFPVYMFRRRVGSAESVLVEPAKLTNLPGFRSLKVPPGDIKIFDKEYDTGNAEVIEPDLDVAAYVPSLPGEAIEQALVYFPVWHVEYSFRGKPYKCVIDGSSGEVFTDLFPVRGSGAYVLVSALGFAAFFGEGLLLFQNVYLSLILMGVTLVGVAVGGVVVARKF
jgi:DNA-directed RNA polymerase subunit RPC12/RpoP